MYAYIYIYTWFYAWAAYISVWISMCAWAYIMCAWLSVFMCAVCMFADTDLHMRPTLYVRMQAFDLRIHPTLYVRMQAFTYTYTLLSMHVYRHWFTHTPYSLCMYAGIDLHVHPTFHACMQALIHTYTPLFPTMYASSSCPSTWSDTSEPLHRDHPHPECVQVCMCQYEYIYSFLSHIMWSPHFILGHALQVNHIRDVRVFACLPETSWRPESCRFCLLWHRSPVHKITKHAPA